MKVAKWNLSKRKVPASRHLVILKVLVQAGLFKQFAICDGRLITGHQQYSGRKVAQTIIAALGQ